MKFTKLKMTERDPCGMKNFIKTIIDAVNVVAKRSFASGKKGPVPFLPILKVVIARCSRRVYSASFVCIVAISTIMLNTMKHLKIEILRLWLRMTKLAYPRLKSGATTRLLSALIITGVYPVSLLYGGPHCFKNTRCT